MLMGKGRKVWLGFPPGSSREGSAREPLLQALAWFLLRSRCARAERNMAAPDDSASVTSFASHTQSLSVSMASMASDDAMQRSKGKNAQAQACKVCPKPRYRNAGYCEVHKRAYDVIYKQCKTKQDSKAAAAWEQIFGENGDETLRQKVLCDYVNNFPDGKCTRGQPRGKIDLTTYTHTISAKQSVEDVELMS